MEKRIGKWRFVFIVMMGSACYAADNPKLVLQAVDGNGYALKEVVVGVPFSVEAIFMGNDAGFKEPSIEKLNAHVSWHYRGRSKSIQSINGVTSVKVHYQYQVRCDQEGQYVVGIATMTDGKNTVRSEPFELQVINGSSGAASAGSEAFVKMYSDRNVYYKGEAVPFTLRVYYQDEQYRVEQIQEPVFEHATTSGLKGPVSGSEKIDGVLYRYVEWTTTFYPKNVGKCVIPAVMAQLTVPFMRSRNTHQFDIFSMFDQMTGGRFEHKQYISNALVLDIKELPATDGSVTAVGNFSSLVAKVSSEQAAQGEGVVFTLELIGNGNFSMIGHPPIVLPDGLKYYESNSKVTQLSKHISKKDFEYIVQGLRPGSYTIEPQELPFFDVEKKGYKTLKTKPITLEIIKSVKQPITSDENDDTSQNETAISVTGPTFVLEKGLLRVDQHREIPGLLFWFLMALPFIFLCLRWIKKWMVLYGEKRAPYLHYKNAFSRARSRISQSKKKDSPQDLYEIFIELFAVRLRLPKSEISEMRIEQTLLQAGMSVEQVAQWHAFFSVLTSLAFLSSRTADTVNLYENSEQWIALFEDIV